MPVARRVVLAPPEEWAEARLVDAARSLALPTTVLRPGDEVGSLVVLSVEPSGAAPAPSTSVTLLPAPASGLAGGPLHLIVLVDRGASMALPFAESLTRFEAARWLAESILRQPVAVAATVTLAVFGRNVDPLYGPVAPSEAPYNAIRIVRAKGPSKPSSALEWVLAQVARPEEPGDASARPVVIVLSDGAGGDARALAEVAGRAARLGVRVYAVTLAPEVDPALASLAAVTGASAFRAGIPPSLAPVFEDIRTKRDPDQPWLDRMMPVPGTKAFDEVVTPGPDRDDAGEPSEVIP